MKRSSRIPRSLAVLAVGTVVAVGVVAVEDGPAYAAGFGTPPTPTSWFQNGVDQDSQAIGGLAFYDASGNVITSGPTDSSPMASYIVGQTWPSAGDTAATVFVYSPVEGANPNSWSVFDQETLTKTDPVTGAGVPASISGITTQPVTVGNTFDDTLETVNATQAPVHVDNPDIGYNNLYEVRLYSSGSSGLSLNYDYAEISVDFTAHTWTEVYSPYAPGAATPTVLTISKSTKIAYGKTVNITGSIKDGSTQTALGGVGVSLYAKVSGSATFKKIKDVQSASNGALTATGVKPTKTTTYQWRYAGTAAHLAASSKSITVTVTRTATIKATSTSIKKGKTTKIYGVVAPVAGGNATIQKKSGTHWVAVGQAVIKRQSLPNHTTAIGYVYTYRGSAKGRFVLRASVPSVTGYGAGVSASTVTITVG